MNEYPGISTHIRRQVIESPLVDRPIDRWGRGSDQFRRRSHNIRFNSLQTGSVPPTGLKEPGGEGVNPRVPYSSLSGVVRRGSARGDPLRIVEIL